jgi:hypothetical protein
MRSFICCNVIGRYFSYLVFMESILLTGMSIKISCGQNITTAIVEMLSMWWSCQELAYKAIGLIFQVKDVLCVLLILDQIPVVLNLLDITSKHHTVSVFLIINIQN